jgi:pimeloyl-ACP methyl ester carboxylesterase
MFAVLVVLTLILAGYLYQTLTDKRDRQRFPAPGRLIDVGGHRLHLHLLGAGPGPTVVIETGAGATASSWAPWQEAIAAFAPVVLYDRAGYGDSDPATSPRTGERVVSELHMALQAAGIPGPYVLVGHSLGGMYVRLFAARYPDDVAGLVLVDARHEAVSSRQPAAMTRLMQQVTRFQGLVRFLAHIGVMRLGLTLALGQLDGGTGTLKALPAPQRDRIIWQMSQPGIAAASHLEMEHLTDMEAQLSRAGDLGDRPLAVLSAAKLQAGGLKAQDLALFKQLWAETQAELAKLSTRAEHQMIDSGHNIYAEEPGVVIAAIRRVVEQVRSA